MIKTHDNPSKMTNAKTVDFKFQFKGSKKKNICLVNLLFQSIWICLVTPIAHKSGMLVNKKNSKKYWRKG